MNIAKGMRSLAIAFAAVLALFAPGPVRADEVDDFQQNAQAALDKLGEATQEILAAGTDGNDAHLLEALLTASEAVVLQGGLVVSAGQDPVKSALGKNAKATRLALANYTKATARAVQRLIQAQGTSDVSAKTLKTALAKLKTATKAGLAFAKKLTKLPKPGFTLTELGNSAGFHKPGSNATFKLIQNPFGPPCAGPFTVTVDNQFGAPVTTVTQPFQVTDPSGQFTVPLGTAGGSARVRIEGCGTSSERLLFNYGDFGKINTTTFRLQPKVLPTGFVSDFGLPYLEYVDATGGTDPCVWTATGLPAGFTLQTVNGGNGITADTVGISGFPYANPNVVGVFDVTITGKDARGRITVRTYTLTILP
jgi:hypothetical protein